MVEKEIRAPSGMGALFTLLALLAAAVAGFVWAVNQQSWVYSLTAVGLAIAAFIAFFGLVIVNPNESRVLLLFGTYKGTLKQAGFYYVNPFLWKRHLSLRIRNFETGVENVAETKDAMGHVAHAGRRHRHPTKVNDRDGNPIEIAAVVVWKVVDTAAALFNVVDFEDFVQVQSESALRNLASQYHYDSDDDNVHSLRSHTNEVALQLQQEIQSRLAKAGVEVLEARISYLAYAPEIASAMLQRQQATAVIAARQKIVEGAVGMVEMALARLSADNIIELDAERKASMVSNLLVVLCGDRTPHPVINTGSIY